MKNAGAMRMFTRTSPRFDSATLPAPAQDRAADVASLVRPWSRAYARLRALLDSRTLQAVAGCVLAGLLLAAYAAMLGRYSVNFPSADDFTQLLNVPANIAHAPTLWAKLHEVFGLAVEHRIATLRLFALIQTHFFGGLDFQWMMYAGSALLVLAGALVVSVVDRQARPLLAAIAAALLLSPANYEATLWATGALQHFGVVGYAIAALYCLVRSGGGWQLAAGALAIAAACTSAGALMLFPTAIALLCFMRRWKAAGAWAIWAALLFGVYFIGYEAPAYQGSLATYLRHPLVPVRFFLMALGALAIDGSSALVVGTVLCLVWGWLAASGRLRTIPPVLLAWALFLALTIAAVTWGRAGFGDQGALVSRYRVYSELVLLVTLAASWGVLPVARRARLLQLALPASLVWFFFCWRHDVAEVERFRISHRIHLDYYVAEGHSQPNDPPAVAFRDFVLEGARQFGGYDPASLARPALRLSDETRALSATNSRAVWIERPVAGKRAMMVNGHGAGHEHEAAIWLENGQRKYRGKLESVPGAPLALGKRSGFLWGVYSLDGVPPGRYRVGVGIDDGAGPTVIWSIYSIDVE